jgi:hypothetical protein
MKKLILVLSLALSSTAFAQNADRIVDNYNTVMNLTNPKDEDSYIVQLTKLRKTNESIGIERQQVIICLAHTKCDIAVSEQTGYPVAVTKINNDSSDLPSVLPSVHDMKTNTDNMELIINPEENQVNVTYSNQVNNIDRQGKESSSVLSNPLTQFMLDDKGTNITYLLGKTVGYQDSQNTEKNGDLSQFKEPDIAREYMTLNIKKYISAL